MPQLDAPQVDVSIKASPGRKSTDLKGVTSIMEIPDEENGVFKGISFFHNGHWQDYDLNDFQTIIIRRCKGASPKG